MISNKYAKDYTIEYSENPRGKLRPKAVYIGKHFVFVASDSEVKRATRQISFLVLLSWLSFFVPLFPLSAAARSWYIIIPHAFVFLPLVFLSASVISLWTAKPPMTREKSDDISQTEPKAAIFMALFSGLATGGLLIRLSDFSTMLFPEDFLFGLCEIVILISSFLLIRNKKFIATCESGS